MLAQTYFFDLKVLESFRQGKPNPHKKRERPQRWKNFYSGYAYDFTAYHDFCKDLLCKNTIRPFLISIACEKLLLYLLAYALIIEHAQQVGEQEYRKWFFILDDSGKKLHLGDERHIYRIATLQKIYEKIYDFCDINPFVKLDNIKCKGLTVWHDDKQAEISGTELFSIKDRLKLHIKLLKLLKQNVNTALAVRVAKFNYKRHLLNRI